VIGDPLPAGFKFMGEPCRANGDIGRRLIQLFCRGADWARFLVIDGEPESKQRPRFGRGPARAHGIGRKFGCTLVVEARARKIYGLQPKLVVTVRPVTAPAWALPLAPAEAAA
jgi:hypothetical protein